MDNDTVMHIAQRTLETALLISAPVLVVALAVGLFAALLQAVTSVRDMTLGMVLKIAAVGVTILVFGGWMLQQALSFTNEIFIHMQNVTQ